MAGQQDVLAGWAATQGVPCGHDPVPEGLRLVVSLLADHLPVLPAFGGQQFGGEIGVRPEVDLVEPGDDVWGEAVGGGHGLDGLDGPSLGAGDHVVEFLAGQPPGQAVGLPAAQIAEPGVGNGRRVDDGLWATVADEDYVHGLGRYRSGSGGHAAGSGEHPYQHVGEVRFVGPVVQGGGRSALQGRCPGGKR